MTTKRAKYCQDVYAVMEKQYGAKNESDEEIIAEKKL